MKKIIITIIAIMAIGTTASAFNYDQALIDIWNKRLDIQKVAPGSPYGNMKLLDWAKKYGWKEYPELFNYYPDKDIVNNLIDQRVNARIKALEQQIAQLQTKPAAVIQPAQNKLKKCWMRLNSGEVLCEVTQEDKLNDDNGRIGIYFLTK
jgi:hypothetical protein